MRNRISVQHCSMSNLLEIELSEGDKTSFVCGGCNKIFDVYADGSIKRSPARNVEINPRHTIVGKMGTFVSNR